MLDEKVELRQKRDFSDVLNASFAFIRQEYKNLGYALLLYAGIPVLIQAILSGIYVDTSLTNFFNSMGNAGASEEFVSTMPGKAMLFNLINMVVQIFLTGLAYCYVVLYVEKGAGNVDVKDVWAKFTSLFASYIGFNILSGLVVILALVALIIPGLYVMIPLSLILITKTAENKGFGDSFSRCFYLVKNHWWQTFGLLFIASIIMLILSAVFGVPAGIIAGTQGILQENVTGVSFPFMITAVISTIGTAIVTPLPSIVISFQYYSLVEHKDNLTLLDKINKVAEEPTIKDE
ncbi:hypothetical protein [Saccharicrinis fermentans]|uniref:DUF7847 domain-containing protein n=1 Tax=Saccharicrinis fermentans DSM 9555 = JCM 21142 TaxID=869213 RepID=W7Y1B5_9BACT|nr:hypothetical protein [Saccharicrinis fermentans]GAF01737.1 hypothetical protein JCM21142_352 [Saccharicrinis fermentans DSM 9555 = JCM 21142]